MIVEGFFSLVFTLVGLIINLFPKMIIIGQEGFTGAVTLLSYALTWFPLDLWIVILANIIFWIQVQCAWIVIEWIYKKVPGIS